jgi:hypothetical protein
MLVIVYRGMGDEIVKSVLQDLHNFDKIPPEGTEDALLRKFSERECP